MHSSYIVCVHPVVQELRKPVTAFNRTTASQILVHYFTVSLYSSNGKQFACRVVQGDGQWPLAMMHCDLSKIQCRRGTPSIWFGPARYTAEKATEDPMVTSSNGNIFRVTSVQGIHRWPVNSPHKGQWRGALLFCFIRALNKRLSKQSWGWWFETPSRSSWRHCNATATRPELCSSLQIPRGSLLNLLLIRCTPMTVSKVCYVIMICLYEE